MSWSLDALPEQSGRTIVITGANSGIGWEAARMLAARGARVVMACRSPERAEGAAQRVRDIVPSAQVEFARLDLSSMRSIRAAAANLRDRFPRIDVLINNAGIMAIPRTLTEDGFEAQIGTNHLGHFALTGLLFDHLAEAPSPRVVNVSSGMHWVGRMDFDDLFGTKRYEKWSAYAQSKLANMLFTYELQRRLSARSSPVVTAACHPGYASTNLQGVGPAMAGSSSAAFTFKAFNAVFAQSAAWGGRPTVHAAIAPDVGGGDLIGPFLEMWGNPRKGRTSAASRNEASAARLWDVSQQLTGVSWLD